MENKNIIVANWKATKTIKETVSWVKEISDELKKQSNLEIVVCPPFTSLTSLKSLFLDSQIKIGAQNVSKFKKGSYTGEVTVEMLDGLAEFCIIGHSERRKYFGETDDDVIEKVKNLLEYSITPILCISDLNQLDSYLIKGKEIIENSDKIIFVDEPPGAISRGGDYKPDSPENAEEVSQKIAEKIGKDVTIIYGGSLNPDNVQGFMRQTHIHGGLVGQASTDPAVFINLISSIS